MLSLQLEGSGPLRVLAIGSHADDIEIGCGGTLLRLAAERELEVHWIVLSANEERAGEARMSAEAFLAGATTSQVLVEGFRDAFFRYGGEVKEYFETLKERVSPDLVLTHHGSDLHQDHRLVAELDVEHLPRSPDPRVRDSEVRRRPRLAQRLRPPGRGDGTAEGRTPARLVPVPAEQALVHRGPVPRAHAAARDGGRIADRLRRGVPRPKGRTGPFVIASSGYPGRTPKPRRRSKWQS